MLSERVGNATDVKVSAAGDPSPGLTIAVHELDGKTCVIVSGELDGASAPALKDSLSAFTGELAGDLVLDIAGLSFIDSSGLALFIELQMKLDRTGHRLTLMQPTPMARRLLAITNLDRYLHIQPPPGDPVSTPPSSEVE